ncbi:MAG: cation transporter [Planctomycetes bacterium]|nr:cation transporter [Planctomycetota bacterium]
MTALCPVAGLPGKRVSGVTVRNLVRTDRIEEVEGGEWFYCDLPDCDVVYFAADGRTLPKDALRVRVGAKENASPQTVCYCFGHTAESIREEIDRTGRSTVVASITAKIKAGECACETMNPKGACCLGDVNKAVKGSFASLDGERIGPAPACAAGDPALPHDCCAPREDAPPEEMASRTARAGILAAGASLLSAIMASACCWLPFVLVAFGASAAGASAAFERLRPIFLGVTPLFLGLGFYLAYFRKGACAPGSACATPSRKVKRFNRAMLWVATVAVAAIAFFPNYVGFLWRRAPPAATEVAAGVKTVTLGIDGMTCEACAASVEKELGAVAGVRRAFVVYGEGLATVTVDAASPPADSLLVGAVERAGYRAQIQGGR